MTKVTETALVPADAVASPTQSPWQQRGKVVRRAGVAAVAAAMVVPFALPAFAAPNESGDVAGVAAVYDSEAQSITLESTAGTPELEALRQELYATTPAELQAVRDEIARQEAEAAAAAEAEAEAAAAARTQAATTTRSGAAPAAAGQQAPAAAAAPAAAGSGSVIANAALDQIGEIQDCVQLVRDSLAAAGIGYSGMGNLFKLGPTISESQATPGDIIYYANGGLGRAHVAVYIGGGQAVHGGWSGNNTVIAGTNIGGSAPVFIDVA